MAYRRYPGAAGSGFRPSPFYSAPRNPYYTKRTNPIRGEEDEIFGAGAGVGTPASAATSGGARKPETKQKAEEEQAAYEAPVDEASQAGAAGKTNMTDSVEALEDELSDDDKIVAEAEAVLDDVATDSAALETAKKEAADWKDRYMRLHAEWDTYRRRTSEQQAEEKKRATENLIESILPVLDDFERTVDYAEQNGETGLLDGVKAVQTKLIDALVKDGLRVIDPVGEAYNALEAQAVGTVPDPDVYDETVKEVYQKGYGLGNKVLRPAMVTVTSGGPARPKEEASEDEE